MNVILTLRPAYSIGRIRATFLAFAYWEFTALVSMMDTHAFASLAHVRILLMPVGVIPQSTFEKYASEIRTFESIRLGDIPADQKDERGR